MRSTQSLWRVTALCAGVCLLSVVAYGGNITIPDNHTPDNPFGTAGTGDVGGEDNETEPGTVNSQIWDLEGMFFDAGTSTLSMVGGWDFVNGIASTASQAGTNQNYDSGDIFIALSTPQYGNTSTPTVGPDGISGTADDWGYGYVLDVNWAAGTYQIYANAPGAPIELVSFGQNSESNPWRRTSGGTAIGPVQSFTSETGLTDAQAGGTLGTFAGGDGNHNRVSFDLSWLSAVGVDEDDDLWFHFTMECGNDNLMGFTSDFEPTPAIPEPASIGLLGLGIVGLVTARVRSKRA